MGQRMHERAGIDMTAHRANERAGKVWRVMQREIKTWLKELRLTGYGVLKAGDGSYWITMRRSSLMINVLLSPGAWQLGWAQGVGKIHEKEFDSFDDLADWVNQKLRDWPDHWSKEPCRKR